MIVLDNNMILLDREAASWEEAVKLAAACLRENGYIGDTYVNDVIERERSYPTGLPCEEAPIAIPHAFSHDVKRTGVCVIRPKTCRWN